MVAPKIILDKSSLRGIGTCQIQSLSIVFDLLIPPILIEELTTELSKKNKTIQQVKSMLGSLAYKVCSCLTDVLPNVERLIEHELLYSPFLLSSKQLPKAHGIRTRGKNGIKGIIYNEDPNIESFRRWANQDFSENEINNSFAIRQQHQEMILNFPNNWKKDNSKLTLSDIVEWHDNCSHIRDNQKAIISTLASSYLPESIAIQAIKRWESKGYPDLKSYAPFCHHYQKLIAIYLLGTKFKLLNTSKHAKTHLDIQYLCYLPFCDVFATADNELLKIAQLVIRSDQTLIDTKQRTLQEEITTINSYVESNSPNNHNLSRRPPKECSVPIIHKAWDTFTGEEQKNRLSSSESIPNKNISTQALKSIKISEESIIYDSNKSLNPIYTEQFDKLSLRQKNLIILDQALQSSNSIINSEISQFYELYADIWRPDTNLQSIFQNCKPSTIKPLWMFDCTGASWIEHRFILLYFSCVLTIDPVINPWSLRTDINPINNPNTYLLAFSDIRNFLYEVKESIDSDQMLLIPRIEGFDPQLANSFYKAGLDRSNNCIYTDEEKMQIIAEKIFLDKKLLALIESTNKSPEFQKPFLHCTAPSLETTILLSRLTNSIPVTSSAKRRNEMLGCLNQSENYEQLKEIESIFQSYRFKFIPEYNPYDISKWKESGFLSEFRKFFVKFLQQIKINPKLDINLTLELRNQLEKLDQEWETLISSKTLDSSVAILEAKLSIYIGLGEFEVDIVNKTLKKSYQNSIEPIERSIFMTISNINKFN